MSNQTSPFAAEKLNIGAKPWRIARLKTEDVAPLLELAETLTEKKVVHTRDESQSGRLRKHPLKYQKQLMGSIAEITVTTLFDRYLKSQGFADQWGVTLYDSVRTDEFRSPEGEYDIRLVNRRAPDIYYEVESRSSIAHNRTLAVALSQFDIIGPYESSIKKNEALKDLYVRPLYAYLNFEKRRYTETSFRELLISGEVQLYVVGGCTRDRMIEKGFAKTMDQKGTEYRVVRIRDGLDILDFLEEVSRTLQHSQGV